VSRCEFAGGGDALIGGGSSLRKRLGRKCGAHKATIHTTSYILVNDENNSKTLAGRRALSDSLAQSCTPLRCHAVQNAGQMYMVA